MYESEEPNPSEDLSFSGDPTPAPVSEPSYVYVHTDALPHPTGMPTTSPAPAPKPPGKRRVLQLSRTAAVLVLAFVVLLSGAAGFTSIG